MSRKLLIILAIPAVLLLSGYLYLRISLRTNIRKEERLTGEPVKKVDTLGGQKVSSLDLRPLLIEKLQQVLKKSSNGLYDLSIGDLNIDALAGKISLSNVTVKPLEAVVKSISLPDNVFTISFKKLDIDGVNPDDILTRKTMDYKSIRLVDPVIEIQHKKSTEKGNDEAFAERFLKEMKKLAVGKLIIEGGTLIVRNGNKQPLRLNEVQVNMNDILIDSATRQDRQRFLFAKSALIRFKGYHSQTKDGMYNFRIGTVTVKAPQQQVQLDDLSFASPYNKIEFTQKHKIATEWYQLKVPTVTVEGVNWWRLLNEEEMVAKSVHAQGGKLAVYFDRRLQPKKRLGNFPNQILMKMPVKINIQRVQMNNLNLSYEEVNPINNQSGVIYMDNVDMAVTHVANDKANKEPVVVSGSALFMHRIPIQARFTFSTTNYQSGAFTAAINVNTPFDGSVINSFAVPLALAKVEKGNLQKIAATMSGDENGANGNVTLLYNDLKLSLLEKDKGDNDMNKKHLTSFFANAFVLKNDNPKKGEEPRKESGSFQRDPYGGFFMLVWKTMLVGALKTIGAPEKIASKKPKPQ